MKQPEGIYRRVYYVKSNKTRNPVAIRPIIKDGIIEWEDTSSGCYVRFEKISLTPENSEIPERIEVLAIDGEVISFQNLTLSLYNRHVKEFVAGSPEFASDEELQNYYLDTNFQAYDY